MLQLLVGTLLSLLLMKTIKIDLIIDLIDEVELNKRITKLIPYISASDYSRFEKLLFDYDEIKNADYYQQIEYDNDNFIKFKLYLLNKYSSVK